MSIVNEAPDSVILTSLLVPDPRTFFMTSSMTAWLMGDNLASSSIVICTRLTQEMLLEKFSNNFYRRNIKLQTTSYSR